MNAARPALWVNSSADRRVTPSFPVSQSSTARDVITLHVYTKFRAESSLNCTTTWLRYRDPPVPRTQYESTSSRLRADSRNSTIGVSTLTKTGAQPRKSIEVCLSKCRA